MRAAFFQLLQASAACPEMPEDPAIASAPTRALPCLITSHLTIQSSLTTNDVDNSALGVMLLPDPSGISGHPHLLVEAGKSPHHLSSLIEKMGHFCSTCTTSDAQIVQAVSGALTGFMGPLPIGTVLCTSAKLTRLENLKYMKAFSFSATGPTFPSTSPTSTTANTYTYTYPAPRLPSPQMETPMHRLGD